MRREDVLIFSCARGVLDKAAKRRIRETIGPDLDWAYIFDRALEEGVAPLLYYNLSRPPFKGCLPVQVLENFRKAYYAAGARNAILSQVLMEILSAFDKAGIESVLLKGLALAYTIYPNIALRPAYDIDLLIHREDVPKAGEALSELGYQNLPGYPEVFVKEGMLVDLHWEFVNMTRIPSRQAAFAQDMDVFWEGARPTQILTRNANTLNTELQLIYLCLHLALHHGLAGLLWLVDILELLKQHRLKIDWRWIQEFTLAHNLNIPVYLSLLYAKEILGAGVEDEHLRALRPCRVGWLFERLEMRVSAARPFKDIRFLLTLLMIDGFEERCQYLRQIILPSVKILRALYQVPSSPQAFAYYPKHLKSVLTSGIGILQAIRKN